MEDYKLYGIGIGIGIGGYFSRIFVLATPDSNPEAIGNARKFLTKKSSSLHLTGRLALNSCRIYLSSKIIILINRLPNVSSKRKIERSWVLP